MIILAQILVVVLGLVFFLWMAWNVIQIAYHSVMLVVCAIGYITMTIVEWVAFMIRWTLIKPVSWIIRSSSK